MSLQSFVTRQVDLQEHPNKAALANAFAGKLGAVGKKRLSRLKRLVVRERRSKLAVAAEQAAASARGALEAALSTRESVRNLLKARSGMCRIPAQRVISDVLLEAGAGVKLLSYRMWVARCVQHSYPLRRGTILHQLWK